MRRSRGGTGVPENHKAVGFLSNIAPDPHENHKATKPAFNVGPISAHQWRFAGGPIMARFYWYLDSLSPSSTNKNVVKVELDPSYKTFWVCA